MDRQLHHFKHQNIHNIMVEPISVTVVAVGSIAAGLKYAYTRGKLKDGDKNLKIEAEQERNSERKSGGPPRKLVNYCLHPHHQLELLVGGSGTIYTCDACQSNIKGERYSCKECNFDVHLACGLSEEMFAVLAADTKGLTTCAHKHPVNMVAGSSKYKCKHCRSEKSNLKYRYECKKCDKKFHLTCAVHPCRMSSFLHPDHELELKTRKHLTFCAICDQRGESNSRVYSCEVCKFYVHPACALHCQYLDHPSHLNHTLVYREIKKGTKAICGGCHTKCERWAYTCSICEGVYFHAQCEVSGTKDRSEFIVKLAELAIEGTSAILSA